MTLKSHLSVCMKMSGGGVHAMGCGLGLNEDVLEADADASAACAVLRARHDRHVRCTWVAALSRRSARIRSSS